MDVRDGLDLYTRMCFLRQFEERTDLLYRRGLIHGPVHLGLGEDVVSGGVFKTTIGLQERFGTDRVWNTPISEQAIADAAMGAAMGGLRPIAEIRFSDFYAICWDQVANEIAKVRYMTGGQVGMPLVLRGANGSGGLGFGSQHGQSVENWAMCVPGLKIVSPASPAEAFGLLAPVVRDDDPVLVFEHKALYARKEEAPEGEHVLPLGQARIVRAGSDLTLVGLSITVGSEARSPSRSKLTVN